MQIAKGKEMFYQKWRDKQAGPYAKMCLTYAERWAELMEAQINKSGNAEAAIATYADTLSYDADIEGIPTGMYVDAARILFFGWKYRKEFKKWYVRQFSAKKQNHMQ